MIRILLCCGGGFSSSAIATRMEKEIKEKTKRKKYDSSRSRKFSINSRKSYTLSLMFVYVI